MRFKQIIENSTTAGSVATVAQPMMTQTRESIDVPGLKPAQQVMKGKAKKKGPYANSIVEGKVKELAKDLKDLTSHQFQEKYKQSKADVRADMKKVNEDDLSEQDLIVIPGQGRLRGTGFTKHDPDRAEHEGQTLKNSLHTIIRLATHLDKELTVRDNFPEWVSEKVGSIKGDMLSVMNYIISSQEMQHDTDAMEGSENKYSNLSNRGVNRGINRAGDDFNRMLDLDQAESPHYKTQHQQDTKQRLKTKPMAGPKGVLPEGSQRVDSIVTDTLQVMKHMGIKNPTTSDAVLALKRVLGDRAYIERRGFYSFYVDQIVDMYSKKGVAEGSRIPTLNQLLKTSRPSPKNTYYIVQGSVADEEGRDVTVFNIYYNDKSVFGPYYNPKSATRKLHQLRADGHEVIGERVEQGVAEGYQLSEFGGDATQFSTPTQSTPTTEQPPRRGYSIMLTGKPGEDWVAKYAWQALEKVLPRDYPGDSIAAAAHGSTLPVTRAILKVQEASKKGSAIVKTGIASEDVAETLVARLAANRIPAQFWRITSEDLDEGIQNSAPSSNIGNNEYKQWMGKIKKYYPTAKVQQRKSPPLLVIAYDKGKEVGVFDIEHKIIKFVPPNKDYWNSNDWKPGSMSTPTSPQQPAIPAKPASALDRVRSRMDSNKGVAEGKIDFAKKLQKKVANHNKAVVQTRQAVGSRVADIGPGGKEHNVDTDAAWDAAKKKVAEGAKVDRFVGHVEKSVEKAGKSKKDAESIAWATANKRGMLDNKNKKK